MNKTNKTRYFVITSLLVVVVGVGTGLVAYYSTAQVGALLGRNGPDELKYVPRDAAIVAYADVREIMLSDVRQKIRSVVPGSEDGRREFQEQTGIDIEADVERVVACLEARVGDNTGGLLLARGHFDDVKVETLMREHGAEVENYGGRRIIAYRNLPAAGDGIALAFLEPGLAAVGSVRMVRTAIDLPKSGDNVRNNTELMDMYRSIPPNHAWAVGRFDALRNDARLPPEVAQRLPAVTWFSVSGRVDSGISGVAQADTRDEDAANNLRDVVRGFLALAKLQAGNRPEFQALAQSLELGGSGKRISLSFSIPAEVFDAVGGLRTRPQTGH